jgi:hypothetical protein
MVSHTPMGHERSGFVRVALVFAAGAVSGFLIPWLASRGLVLFFYDDPNRTFLQFFDQLAVSFGIPLGAFVALIGERLFLRGLPDRTLLWSWPGLFSATLAMTALCIPWVGAASGIVIPVGFLLSCVLLRIWLVR